MPHCKVGTENGAPIEIYYEDHGSGQPAVLIHGYPLSGDSWERQERELLAAGYRVIRVDRRGFGASSKPTVGYDYDTFAADLSMLLEHLDLHDVLLIGFSMGTGEVTRYLGRYGSDRVAKAVLIGAIPPFLLKRDDNPEGVDAEVFDALKAAIVKDRYAALKGFLDDFSNVDVFAPERISDHAWQASFNVAAASGPHATYVCVDSWLEDFRDGLEDRRANARGARHGRADPAVRGNGRAAPRPDRRPAPRARRGRAAQHLLDPSRGGQSGPAGVPRRARRAPSAPSPPERAPADQDHPPMAPALDCQVAAQGEGCGRRPPPGLRRARRRAGRRSSAPRRQ
jgi:non-heme chloroperoxidase